MADGRFPAVLIARIQCQRAVGAERVVADALEREGIRPLCGESRIEAQAPRIQNRPRDT